MKYKNFIFKGIKFYELSKIIKAPAYGAERIQKGRWDYTWTKEYIIKKFDGFNSIKISTSFEGRCNVTEISTEIIRKYDKKILNIKTMRT
jgi:hypothetical protein